MSFIVRKALVLGMVGAILLVANIMIVAQWLSEAGAVQGALYLRREFLTGTAITIVIVLLILLANPDRAASSGLSRRCSVCDHGIRRGSKYCSACGSRI